MVLARIILLWVPFWAFCGAERELFRARRALGDAPKGTTVVFLALGVAWGVRDALLTIAKGSTGALFSLSCSLFLQKKSYFL